MQQYVDLVNRVLREGEPRADRTGVGTLAVFGGRIEFDLRERFPLVTVKETRWKTAFLEMLWFLRGETNTDYLHRHGCTLWDAWATAHGNLGPVYGAQWRRWRETEWDDVDQIAVLIDGLRNSQLGWLIWYWAANALSAMGESSGWLKPMLTTLNLLTPKVFCKPWTVSCNERVVLGHTWKQPV